MTTMEERIERAVVGLASADWSDDWSTIEVVEAVARWLIPELLGDNPTAWLAPMEATEEMLVRTLPAVHVQTTQDDKRVAGAALVRIDGPRAEFDFDGGAMTVAAEMRRDFRLMRDAYLATPPPAPVEAEPEERP